MEINYKLQWNTLAQNAPEHGNKTRTQTHKPRLPDIYRGNKQKRFPSFSFLLMPNALYVLFFNMKGVYSHFNGKMSHIPYVVAAAHWTLVCDISLLPFVLALFCVTL